VPILQGFLLYSTRTLDQTIFLELYILTSFHCLRLFWCYSPESLLLSNRAVDDAMRLCAFYVHVFSYKLYRFKIICVGLLVL
jgi:hypothetical protein